MKKLELKNLKVKVLSNDEKAKSNGGRLWQKWSVINSGCAISDQSPAMSVCIMCE